MAQQTTVSLIDDVDGSPADETVSFGLGGSLYEIDLTHEHAESLRSALAEWITAGRRSGRANGSKPASRRVTVTDVDPAAVRAWAASNGKATSARGRVPRSIIDQYKAAGN